MTYNDDLILLIHFAISLVCYIFFKKNYFNKFFFYFALLNVFFLSVHPIIISNFAVYYKNFGIVIRILSFLMIISTLGKSTFLFIYVRCLFIISLFNLVLFIDHAYFFSLSQPISSFFNLLTTYSENVFYENYIFYGKIVSTSVSEVGVIKKNPGIFGEGGYYQYFLNLALIINLFYFKKSIFNKANILFIISIFTTFSTVAYLNFLLLLFTYSFSIMRFRQLVTFFPLLVVFSVYLFQTETIYSKLFDFNSIEFRISTIRRMTDTYIDLLIIKEYPWFGTGIGGIEDLYSKLASKFSGGTSSSNGILQYTSGFGLVGIVLAIYPFILFGFKKKITFIVTVCNLITGLTQEMMMMPMFLLSIMLINKTARK